MLFISAPASIATWKVRLPDSTYIVLRRPWKARASPGTFALSSSHGARDLHPVLNFTELPYLSGIDQQRGTPTKGALSRELCVDGPSHLYRGELNFLPSTRNHKSYAMTGTKRGQHNSIRRAKRPHGPGKSKEITRVTRTRISLTELPCPPSSKWAQRGYSTGLSQRSHRLEPRLTLRLPTRPCVC